MASARTEAQHSSPSILHGSGRRRSHIASDALPLPVNLTNTIFAGIFCWASGFLLKRWREKVPNSTPLYQLSMGEKLGILASIASVIYLLCFCGIVFVQPFVSRNTDSPLDSEGDEDITETDAAGNIPEQPEGKIFEDEGLASAVSSNQIPSYSLEAEMGDCHRAASVRKRAVELVTGRSLEGLPLSGFDYSSVLGQCCEMVIGHVQIPVGVAGPLKLDGMEYMIPMATTEGCLVASTNRGCKAISHSGGATSILLRDGMSRAPVVKFPSVKRAADLKFYLEDEDNFDTISAVFNRTSRFARLHHVKCAVAGMNTYLRFSCATGDAMGMNMISKGVQNVLDYLQDLFLDMEVISISGNFCADKKPTAVNWIEGRGKSVICEAIIKEEVVTKILKTSVSALVELNTAKNLVGSAMAGSVGGFNAHASNIVSAIFIATGQDPAQNIESSHCITVMEAINGGHDLHIAVTMPSIEVGTVGGGTQLASQAACLDLLGVKGSNNEMPGRNAQTLAKVVAGGVLAGELSLMSALAAGQLVKSHMRYNRSSRNIAAEGANNPKGKAAGRVCFSDVNTAKAAIGFLSSVFGY